MANAKRCDKCGEFYIVNTIHQNLAVSILEGVCVLRRMDLCDSCYKELQVFLGFDNMDEEVEE